MEVVSIYIHTYVVFDYHTPQKKEHTGDNNPWLNNYLTEGTVVEVGVVSNVSPVIATMHGTPAARVCGIEGVLTILTMDTKSVDGVSVAPKPVPVTRLVPEKTT